MKLTGKIAFYAPAEKGESTVLITTQYPFLTQLDEFKDKLVEVEIKEHKAKRSLDQNAFLWAIIGDIDRKQNGRRSEEASDTIYCQLIKAARIKPEFMLALPDTVPALKKVFRVVVDRGTRDMNGKTMTVYECFLGSSYFDTKEMSDLIETALDYADRVGVVTYAYREQWKGVVGD